MRNMMQQNFLYSLYFYLHLRPIYSCHYIKEKKLRMNSYLEWNRDATTLLVVKLYSMITLTMFVLVCMNRTISK